MANHKSAAKRARQTIRKTEHKSATRASIRTFEKKLRAAIASKDSKAANELFVTFTSKLGKAAQKGLYHANTAARKVGRLATQVHTLSK